MFETESASEDPADVGEVAQMKDILVECYSGYRGEETPRRFWLGKNRIEIREVIDRWIGPDHRYFKVLGDEGSVYILRFDVESVRWELTLFDSERRRTRGMH